MLPILSNMNILQSWQSHVVELWNKYICFLTSCSGHQSVMYCFVMLSSCIEDWCLKSQQPYRNLKKHFFLITTYRRDWLFSCCISGTSIAQSKGKQLQPHPESEALSRTSWQETCSNYNTEEEQRWDAESMKKEERVTAEHIYTMLLVECMATKCYQASCWSWIFTPSHPYALLTSFTVLSILTKIPVLLWRIIVPTVFTPAGALLARVAGPWSQTFECTLKSVKMGIKTWVFTFYWTFTYFLIIIHYILYHRYDKCTKTSLTNMI